MLSALQSRLRVASKVKILGSNPGVAELDELDELDTALVSALASLLGVDAPR